jgi:hypothetical protein
MLLFYLTYQHVAINVTSPFSGELSGVSGVLCIMEQIASKLLHFIFGVAGLILTLTVVLGHAPRQTSPPADKPPDRARTSHRPYYGRRGIRPEARRSVDAGGGGHLAPWWFLFLSIFLFVEWGRGRRIKSYVK